MEGRNGLMLELDVDGAHHLWFCDNIPATVDYLPGILIMSPDLKPNCFYFAHPLVQLPWFGVDTLEQLLCHFYPEPDTEPTRLFSTGELVETYVQSMGWRRAVYLRKVSAVKALVR